jgi:hypothetical protein
MFDSAKRILTEAIKAVPAVKYALGVAGIMAALALGTALFKTPQAALLGAVPMLILMVLLLVFAAGARLKGALRLPALFLTWAVLILFVAATALTVSSVFFSKPRPFQDLITELAGGTVSAEDQLAGAKRLAVEMMTAFLAKDFKTFFEFFPQDVQARTKFAEFAAEGERQTFQFAAPIAYRRFENHAEQGGYLTIYSIVEFDQSSVFREGVVFSRRGANWVPFGTNIWPAEWPTTSISKTLKESAPSEVLHTVAEVSDADFPAFVRTRYENWWIQGGWRVRVDSPDARKDRYTCDVRTTGESGGGLVVLHAVLGGCDWKPGQGLLVWGRIARVERDHLELNAVRAYGI